VHCFCAALPPHYTLSAPHQPTQSTTNHNHTNHTQQLANNSLFFQHLPRSCQWHWGLCWAHCVSDDLVTWRALPPAVVPSPGWYDADGAFSGALRLGGG
jgi:hypothetical protein